MESKVAMEPSSAYYKDVLRTELTRRSKRNPQFSLRAFAKLLGVDVAALSRVLADKGSLSLKSAERVVRSLRCSAEARRLFLASVAKDLKRRALAKVAPECAPGEGAVKALGEDTFKQVADWEYYAILEATFLKDFSPTPAWIAGRLGIAEERARLALARLLDLGLLEQSGAAVKKSDRSFHSKADAGSSSALRRHQRQLAEAAARSVDGVEPGRRAITTIVVPTDPRMIEAARQLIEDFAWQVSRHLCGGEYEEVYALTINLFPLTRGGKKHAES